jgi:bifunctional non-homologous end joining protein LigD
MELDKYRAKRDFTQTPEPPGKEEPAAPDSLRFVVHKHHATRLHWDLRLELDGVLKSWAVPKGPSLDPDDKKLAVMVEDHPIDYQWFEGVIPEGNYGAGPVMIWDRGTYHAAHIPERGASEKALEKGLAKGHISFILEGERLKGEFALVRMKKAEENAWLLIKKHDEFAASGDIAHLDTSVATGRAMPEILAGSRDDIEAAAAERPAPADDLLARLDLSGVPRAPMPAQAKPMLATLVKEAFDREGWLFEIKWDGYRALAEVKGGSAHLYSRHNLAFDDRFPVIARALESFPFDALFDGEIVVVDAEGRASFQFLQDYPGSPAGTLVYYVFDILHFNGHDLTRLPLARRKEILKEVLPRTPSVRLSEHVEKEGISLFEAARKNAIEGIVAKDAASPYRQGQRTREWLKIKAHLQQEAVIGGYTAPQGGRKGFGALVLGVYEKAATSDVPRLVCIGHTGGGFTDRQLQSLLKRLEALRQDESPFERAPRTNAAVTWVKPVLVCEVRFTEWTNEGLMRHPIFLALREDVDPVDVRRELPSRDARSPSAAPRPRPRAANSAPRSGLVIIDDERVQLSNTAKIFWPDEGYTKGDVIDYYRRMAPFILPYLKDRPQSLHRHPDGMGGQSFFQKNVDHLVPGWVRTTVVYTESEEKDYLYLLCQDEATLVYMANLGCIEINPWHSRVPHLEAPDFMVLDIDPLDVPFVEVVRTAVETREVLRRAGVEGFCKTSGATGLHIYVPLGAQYSYEQSTQFAKLVNLLVHARLPDTTSMERNPGKRRGKVYLDYLQNSRGQTLAAPYSLRPRKGATVSTPLAWSEVDGSLDPSKFTINTIGDRLERVGDLWKGVLSPGIDMALCLGRLEEMLKGPHGR